MDLHALPLLGCPLVLNDTAGNGLALGASADDPAFLCAVIEDAAGRVIIRNLIDGESEALLRDLLHQRAAARTAATIPPYRSAPDAQAQS